MSFRIVLNGVERQVEILRRRPHLVISVDGREHDVEDPGSDGEGLHLMTIAGAGISVARAGSQAGQTLRIANRTYSADLLVEGEEAGGGQTASEVRAPMPGAVISVEASPGDEVEAGDPILTIESMKLQTVLAAPRKGVIAEILFDAGEAFEKDQLLARMEEEAEADA